MPMLISDLINSYLDPLPVGLVLDRTDVEKALKEAIRFYAGYATLSGLPLAADGIHSDINATNGIDDPEFELNHSEWSIIKPLFERYVEKTNQVALEATRGMGLDVYGRTVSEIQMDIATLEAEMPQKAFYEPFFSV